MSEFKTEILGLLAIVTIFGFIVAGVVVVTHINLNRGEGTFNGTLVDSSWEGVFFKSCELTLQLGQQSSTTAQGSTLDKTLCDAAIDKVGKRVFVHYKYAFPFYLRTDTVNIVDRLESVE